MDGLILQPLQGQSLVRRHRMKSHTIPGLQLTDLPQLCSSDTDRTNKPTQARPIRTQYHRHIAGEIDRADGVGIIVNIGWMKTGLTSIGPSPFRPWTQ